MLKQFISEYQIELVVILEVKNENSKLPNLAKCINMQHFFHGGNTNSKIWFLWSKNINCSNFVCSGQSITSDVVCGKERIRLSAIYASCDLSERRVLWNHIKQIEDNTVPWLISGDFNIINSTEEKLGRLPPDRQAVHEFVEFQNDLNVRDMGYKGPIYTWSNNNPQNVVFERLDRVLGNELAATIPFKVKHGP